MSVDQVVEPERAQIRCRNCGHEVIRKPGTKTGWTHGDPRGWRYAAWSGVRCPGEITGAVPEVTE